MTLIKRIGIIDSVIQYLNLHILFFFTQ